MALELSFQLYLRRTTIRFNKEARKSLAETLKVVSYLGPAGASLLFKEAVLESEPGTLFFIYCVVFLVLQVLAIGLVAYEDEDKSSDAE